MSVLYISHRKSKIVYDLLTLLSTARLYVNMAPTLCGRLFLLLLLLIQRATPVHWPASALCSFGGGLIGF